MSNIYESEAFSQTQCGSMHPGGLRLTDRAARLAALARGMRMADIGCGTGATAAFLMDRYKLNVVGLEISDKLLEIGLESNPGLNLIRWDGKSLPFASNSLDAVIFECTLSVLENPGHTLAQAATALKQSGSLIISDVCLKHCPETGMGHPALCTSDALTEMLAAAGFDIIVSEDHTPALRSFAAELWERTAAARSATLSKSVTDDSPAEDRGLSTRAFDPGCFFGASVDIKNVRLSELGYILIIAKKTGE